MGNKITTRLINLTDNDMEIREFRGLIADTNRYIKMTAVNARGYTDIDVTMYGGADNQGGQPSKLMIFCNGNYLTSRPSIEGDFLLAGGEVVLSGQRFIDSKTVTIGTVADRNVVDYKVTFEPRDASASLTDFQAEVKQLKTQLAKANDLLDKANAAKLNAEAEVKRTKEEENEKLKAAYGKGYEAGIQRAALKYTRVVNKMVRALEDRLPDFYKRGYAAGADAIAIQAEPGFLRQLPEPVVPDFELPYTKEEWPPLPLEDDEDEEMAEASGKDKPAEGGNDGATEADGPSEVAA